MKAQRLVPVLLLALLVWACGQKRDLAAWELYDGCALSVTTFSGMIGCGEPRHKAYCAKSTSDPACGTLGNAVAAYASSLVKLIDGKQLTDGEAARKWAQFELMSPEEQIRVSQAAVAAAANGAR